MDLGTIVVKSIYSPFAILSFIRDGIGGRAGLGSDVADCPGGMMVGLICEVLVVEACSVVLCTGAEASDRRSSSPAANSALVTPPGGGGGWGFLAWRIADSWSSSALGSLAASSLCGEVVDCEPSLGGLFVALSDGLITPLLRAVFEPSPGAFDVLLVALSWD